jgi:hypothetical protein
LSPVTFIYNDFVAFLTYCVFWAFGARGLVLHQGEETI